ncbi:MAG: C69 family dipeptidase [Bowdeniella nasicola]|nr:C69 family dipeptidase [Bowdeniella nasicola]
MGRLAKASVFTITALASYALAVPSIACTGVIIGGDLTDDGSTIFGRTEDLEQRHPKRLLVHDAGEYPAGEAITGAETGVSYTQEKDSLAFTSVSDVTPEYGRFDEAGFNSAGVAVDATISASANTEVQEVDPYTEKGWTEGVLSTVLLANATSARDGIELMASLIDEDGANEGNALVLGDRDEVWYMEIYSGHQYAAMKYPSDRFSIMPNAFWMTEVDCADTENYICSESLEETAREAGTWAETDGTFNPAASYNTEGSAAQNSSRVWSGITFLDPGAPVTIDDEAYPLLNTPSDQFTKVSIADVMDLQRNRFEGVDDDLAKRSLKVVTDTGLSDVDGNEVEGARYPIGNTNTMEAHIFQLPATDMPAEVPGTLWQTIGTPQGAPYLPYYGTITGTISQMQSTSEEEGDSSSYYWIASDVNFAVDQDRATLQEPVREYLQMIEAPLIAGRPAEDAALAQEYESDPQAVAQETTARFAERSSASLQDLLALRASLQAYDTVHTLSDQAGNSVTVQPNEVIVPTEFTATPAATDDLPDAEGEAGKAAWDLALEQRLPWDQKRVVQPSQPVVVSLVAPSGVEADAAHLYALDDQGFTELDFDMSDDGALTFETTVLGRVVLTVDATADDEAVPVPGVQPSQEPTTGPGKDPLPMPSPTDPGRGSLARTGADTGVLSVLAALGLFGGAATSAFAYRRRIRR